STQGTKTYKPVAEYLEPLSREIAMVAEATPAGAVVNQIHWGGGSPSVLSAEDILRLKGILSAAFPGVADARLEVELDPRDMTEAKLDAFAAAGLSRASIGVQDFAASVQAAIGRVQGETVTRQLVEGLRARGVPSVSMDLVYGLPRQTLESLERTVEAVIDLAPDRLALFGYAHVPWMARRQTLIDAATLPDTAARVLLAGRAREMLIEAGYVAVGIDHFAKPHDTMARAVAEGRLRRNFQGYTTDQAAALIGFGASAIGYVPQGYVQNIPATAAWRAAVEDGHLPIARGVAFSLDDRMRAQVISDLLCRFTVDIGGLRAAFGDMAGPVVRRATALIERAPEGALTPLPGGDGFEIAPAWRDRTRLIAAAFDAYLPTSDKRHSLAV
ncbi:MAG: radical SAM protein, partial [Pseudomonadota bacterium]